MAIPELAPQYECKQCKTSFEQPVSCGCGNPVKCPECGSTDTEISGSFEELLQLLEDMGRTGG
ncbi:MAG: hypothetical protein R6U89_04185 [Dehalococcoidia bacterium]